MNMNLKHYNLLAKLFQYPSKETVFLAEDIMDYCSIKGINRKEIDEFIYFCHTNPVCRLEEIYSRTFHVQAICYLDLGYVIFGEDYKRGAFLVNMKNEQMKAGNDCGDELADNLSNVLNLIPLIKDREFMAELVTLVLLPAIDQMLSEFQASRMELKKNVLKKKHKALIQEDEDGLNIYQFLLLTLKRIIEFDFKSMIDMSKVVKVNPTFGNEFLNGCSTCETVEKLAKEKNIVIQK